MVIGADRGRVFEIATDYELFPEMMPGRFPSVRVRSRRGNVAVVEERVRLSGRELSMMTKHVADAPGSHEVFVIGGDAKGTHVVERYEEVPQGTRVTVDADIRLGGAMRIAGLLGRRRLRRGVEEAAAEFARAVEERAGAAAGGGRGPSRDPASSP